MLGLASQTCAALVNVTVDDTYGNQATGDVIQYAPDGVWNLGQECPACSAQPNPEQIYFGTWHDGTFSVNSLTAPDQLLTATLVFEGMPLKVTHNVRVRL